MFEFFHFIAIQPFQMGYDELVRGHWIGIVIIFLGAAMNLLIIMVPVMIIAFVYEMIDTSGPQQKKRGFVTETRYAPAHTTLVGKVTIYHPARWYATMAVSDNAEELQIDQELFDNLQPRDQLDVMVTTGKLSKKTRIVDLATQ